MEQLFGLRADSTFHFDEVADVATADDEAADQRIVELVGAVPLDLAGGRARTLGSSTNRRIRVSSRPSPRPDDVVGRCQSFITEQKGLDSAMHIVVHLVQPVRRVTDNRTMCSGALREFVESRLQGRLGERSPFP